MLYFLKVVVVLKSVYFRKCGVMIWGTDEYCVVHKQLVSFGVVRVFQNVWTSFRLQVNSENVIRFYPLCE